MKTIHKAIQTYVQLVSAWGFAVLVPPYFYVIYLQAMDMNPDLTAKLIEGWCWAVGLFAVFLLILIMCWSLKKVKK